MANKEKQKQVKPAPSAAATAVQNERRPPAGWRKWLYRLLAMTAVPAFFLILLEGLLRLYGYGYPAGFFLTKEIGGQEAYTDNPDFGRRFFPPGLTRGIAPTVFPGTKTAGTYRIFILGESAAMGYPDSAYHFGRILHAMLQDRYPDTRFEVVNTAMTAINSHVILPIARDCTDHQPDLFVVYMGNNEVVGPYGASGVLGPYTPNLALIRASIQIKATRTGQLLGDLMHRVSASGPTRHSWGGMSMFVGSQVPADDPRLRSVYDHFTRNLQDICTVGLQAGAKVLVCTVATNLKDSAPFASVPTPDLSNAQAEEWKKRYEEGISRETAQDHAGAVSHYRDALKIDGQFADLHFRLARCLVALKQPEEAREHYVLARDLDALRFRTDTRINEAIRSTARDREDGGVYLADVEQAFAEFSTDGIPGEELFYEHVHLTFEGNYQLARAVLKQVVRILPDSVRPRGAPSTPVLSIQECQERLPFTEWNRHKGWNAIIGMASHPPFPNQVDHEERQKRWRGRLAEMKKRLGAGGARDALAAYRRALERNRDDLDLHKDFAKLLWEQGHLAEAVQHVNEVLKRVPHDYIQLSRLAEILGMQGNMDEALAKCEACLKLNPADPQLHDLMGRLLLEARKPDQAAKSFEQALKLYPDAASVHTNLGDALAMQKEYSKAADAYKEALRVDKDNVKAHFQLGRYYNASGQPDVAQHHLQEALRISPSQAQIHAELATAFVNQGDLDKAVIHMQKAADLQPELKKALESLRLMQKKNR